MISVIVCSVDVDLLNQLRNILEETIGSSYELLIKDNTVNPVGIGKAYNNLAKLAKGEFLCFIHEDVTIETHGWGSRLENQAMNVNTGVIGFAGAKIMDSLPYWYYKSSLTYHFVQRLRDGRLYHDFTKGMENEKSAFEEVAVLDGMFLFCKRSTWLSYPFDEETFSGFHLYDIDFTFSVRQQYTNYVCQNIKINHFSLGSLRIEYYKCQLEFFKKWHTNLPFLIEGHQLPKKKDVIPTLVIEMMDKSKLSGKFTWKYLKKSRLIEQFYEFLLAKYWVIKTRVKLSVLRK